MVNMSCNGAPVPHRSTFNEPSALNYWGHVVNVIEKSELKLNVMVPSKGQATVPIANHYNIPPSVPHEDRNQDITAQNTTGTKRQ